MTPIRICLVGATGLVGSRVIAGAVGRPDVRLVAVARREVPLPKGARMEVLVADPASWADAIAAANAKVLVCALGTTWSNAGKDEARFRAVDHDLVLDCVKAAKAAGIPHVIVVSSAGAGRHARSRYLRVKAETEDALIKLHLRRLDILRPGLLVGRREERRPLERLAMFASPVADRFMLGGAAKYRSIKADILAQAIFGLAREKAAGRFFHEGEMLKRAARRGISHLPG